MKVIFRMNDGTSVSGEGETWHDALVSAGLQESDRSRILSSYEEVNTAITERSEDHPLYGLTFKEGELRPLLQNIVYLAAHQSMLVWASPKKHKWLHLLELPPQVKMSFLEFYEHHLTNVVLPNQEALLKGFKNRYTSKKSVFNEQLARIIDELEEVLAFHEVMVEKISQLRVDIERMVDVTMGALLTQQVDVLAPFDNMRKRTEEELLFHYFNSNWLSKQVSMYQHEVQRHTLAYTKWETIFTTLYEWVAFCRAYNYNRIGQSPDNKNLFTTTPKIPLSMILSRDPYQYVISEEGYVEGNIRKHTDLLSADVPKAIYLRAACYKWLRMCVLGRKNVEYLPNGQIALVKLSALPSQEEANSTNEQPATPVEIPLDTTEEATTEVAHVDSDDSVQ